jgi:hypothetical protein
MRNNFSAGNWPLSTTLTPLPSPLACLEFLFVSHYFLMLILGELFPLEEALSYGSSRSKRTVVG